MTTSAEWGVDEHSNDHVLECEKFHYNLMTKQGWEANAEEAPHFQEARVITLLRWRRSPWQTHCHLCTLSPRYFVGEGTSLAIGVIQCCQNLSDLSFFVTCRVINMAKHCEFDAGLCLFLPLSLYLYLCPSLSVPLSVTLYLSLLVTMAATTAATTAAAMMMTPITMCQRPRQERLHQYWQQRRGL